MNGTKIVGGGGAGAGLGAALVYVAGRFGAHLTPEDGALIAATVIGACAFVVHNGLRGALGVLWRGPENPPPPPSPAPPPVA
jgi:hypothetical protein